jgi:hypothetical protein
LSLSRAERGKATLSRAERGKTTLGYNRTHSLEAQQP